jgi:hypothetical protein
LNLSNTSLGDSNTRLLFRAWNSPLQQAIDQMDDDESLEEDVFREDSDDDDNVLSLISLRIANNRIEQSAAKELAKFLKNTGSCLAEVPLSLLSLSLSPPSLSPSLSLSLSLPSSHCTHPTS